MGSPASGGRNEDNVDPNRNFPDSGTDVRGQPAGLCRAEPLAQPGASSLAAGAFSPQGFAGDRAAGITHPETVDRWRKVRLPGAGLFYGGSRTNRRTNEILAQNLGRWVQGCEEVIHLDFHTGLGPSATYKLLIDFQLTDRQRTRLVDWFGPDSFEACDPSLTSYHVRGGFDRWCLEQVPGCDYLHLCAEFGTYGPIQVVGGLRAENQAHHWGKLTDRATVRAKQRLKELFCPASPRWRTHCYATAVGLVEKAVACLAETATNAAG